MSKTGISGRISRRRVASSVPLKRREILYRLGAVAKEGICGMEVVEVSPPYDISDITSSIGVRAIGVGSLPLGKIDAHRAIIRGASS